MPVCLLYFAAVLWRTPLITLFEINSQSNLNHGEKHPGGKIKGGAIYRALYSEGKQANVARVF